MLATSTCCAKCSRSPAIVIDRPALAHIPQRHGEGVVLDGSCELPGSMIAWARSQRSESSKFGDVRTQTHP